MEKPGLYALAGLGIAEGAWRYYVRPELTAKRAWLVMAGSIALYEWVCPPGELMSEGADRLINKHPAAGRAAIIGLGVVTTAHVANMFTDRRDPFKRALDIIRP